MHSESLLSGLSEFYKIFADTSRLRILDLLLNKKLCVNKIAKKLNMTQSAVSHQLRYLRSCNLVKYEKIGKQVIYSISDEHIRIIMKYGIQHIMEEFK